MGLGVRSRTIKGFRRVSAYWNARTELERLIAGHRGEVINKWKHYFEIYDQHFARFRDRDITLLEIGVAGGGSLVLWRRYFGQRARIVGVDINPDCKRFEAPDIRVRIGNQGDPAFLEQLASEMGPFDIVIDDGSHRYDHQLSTFRSLFKHIREDGVYSCEDLWSSYWPQEFGGGVRKAGTYVEFLKELIDELNAWFWRENVESEPDAIAKFTHGIHFYPALVIIEKRRMEKPIVTPVGRTPELADEQNRIERAGRQ
jgi:cephalosporin hydroxylase